MLGETPDSPPTQFIFPKDHGPKLYLQPSWHFFATLEIILMLKEVLLSSFIHTADDLHVVPQLQD